MNDRFRFRFWDEEKSRYVKVGQDIPNGSHLIAALYEDDPGRFHLDIPEDFVIEQCTGARDALGTLIYEGDIIEDFYPGDLESDGIRHRIIWHRAYSGEMFCAFAVDGSIHDFYGGIPNTDLVKVIGNIHENEDLLK